MRELTPDSCHDLEMGDTQVALDEIAVVFRIEHRTLDVVARQATSPVSATYRA